MKKIILTIATAMISVFATAQEVMSLPTFIYTGSSPTSPYILEIRFYDQFAEQVTIEKDGYSFENSLPFQIATINLLSYENGEWKIIQHLFHYEPKRRQNNGGQISLEYRKTPDDDGGWKSWVEPQISRVNPRDYDNSWLLLKNIYISGDFINPFSANTPNLNEEISCSFEIKKTGEPSKSLWSEVFTGHLFRLDDNGNPIL
jgi:hypothetical protein